jgi:hypothetical protein
MQRGGSCSGDSTAHRSGNRPTTHDTRAPTDEPNIPSPPASRQVPKLLKPPDVDVADLRRRIQDPEVKRQRQVCVCGGALVCYVIAVGCCVGFGSCTQLYAT